jgi:CRP-like cAMP-binding protein
MPRMKLSDLNLLEILNSAEYAQTLSLFSEEKAKKKEIVFPPNYVDNKVLIVKKGRMRVYLTLNGKEFTLSILEPGDVFTTHTRAFTQCLDDCVFLVISAQKFQTILVEHPTFAFTIIKVLGDLLHNSITIINGLMFKDVATRLAEFLVSMADNKGIKIDAGIQLKLGLNVEQIAMLVGASRQTISGVFADLAKAGLVSKEEQGTIIILNIEVLRELVS